MTPTANLADPITTRNLRLDAIWLQPACRERRLQPKVTTINAPARIYLAHSCLPGTLAVAKWVNGSTPRPLSLYYRADACKRNPSNEQPNAIRSLARAWALWILVPFQQLGGSRDGVHDTDSKPCRPNHNTQPPARCYLAAARLPGTQSTATGQPSPLLTTFQAFPHHLWGSLAGALLGFLYRASSPRGLYAVPSREFVPQRSLKYWFWNLWFWVSVLLAAFCLLFGCLVGPAAPSAVP